MPQHSYHFGIHIVADAQLPHKENNIHIYTTYTGLLVLGCAMLYCAVYAVLCFARPCCTCAGTVMLESKSGGQCFGWRVVAWRSWALVNRVIDVTPMLHLHTRVTVPVRAPANANGKVQYMPVLRKKADRCAGGCCLCCIVHVLQRF